MNVEEINIGMSSLTGEVFAGKLKKNKTEWLSKKEITSDFTRVVIEKYGPSHQSVVDVDGKPSYRVVVVPIDKEVKIDGKICK